MSQRSVFIVEDDEDDRFLISHAFQHLGYTFKLEFFGNGLEALDYLEKNEVDPILILCDINMPKMNGIELKENIRKHRKMTVDCIPFVFFTTGTNEEIIQKAYELSAQGIFRKPRDIQGLHRTIHKIVEYWTECITP